jgi:hypothetical protein
METENNIEIQIKRSFLDFFKRRLCINQENISYEKKSIACANVKEVRYGIIQMYINGIKANRMYEIGIKGNTDKPIRISFQSARLFVTNKKMEETYHSIVNCIWKNISLRLVNEAIQNLENGKSFVMEKIEVQPKGILMQINPWFGKKETYFVEWKNLLKSEHEGSLTIYSRENKKVKLKLNFQKDWNTPVLASLLEYLWKDGRAYLLTEEKFKPI